MIRAAVGVVLLLAAMTPRVNAQRVQGRLIDEAGRPVVGSLVTLLDTYGRPLLTTLSGTAGNFSIAPADSGRFALRVERPGHRNFTTRPFRVGRDSSITLNVTSDVAPTSLASLEPTDASTCVSAPEPGSAFERFWNEARKALLTTAFAEASGLTEMNALRYGREFDSRGTMPPITYDKEQLKTRHLPYPGIPVGREAEGFIATDSVGAAVYYAASAAALAADSFLEQHCFTRIVRDRARIGVEFEPVRAARTAGIAGTLWLERENGALRAIEYEFRDPRDAARRGARGFVEYTRLTSGMPGISRWWLRIPIQREVTRGGRTESVQRVREEGALVLGDGGTPLHDPDNLIVSLGSTHQLDPLLVEALRPEKVTPNMRTITPEELRTGVRTDAFEAIMARRPNWFARSGIDPRRDPLPIYVDGFPWTDRNCSSPDPRVGRSSTACLLRQIPAAWIDSIRYYDPIEAAAVFGMGHHQGAIAITFTRR